VGVDNRKTGTAGPRSEWAQKVGNSNEANWPFPFKGASDVVKPFSEQTNKNTGGRKKHVRTQQQQRSFKKFFFLVLG